jgi:hypothetical protein
MDNDRRGRWANIVMDNGDPCWIGIAQTGVLVRKSRVGLFGAKLYEEKNVYKAAKTAQALDALYPSKLTPSSMSNPVLAAFVNSVLHCRDLAETTRILNEAIGIEESLAETARVLSQVVTADDLKPPARRSFQLTLRGLSTSRSPSWTAISWANWDFHRPRALPTQLLPS